MEEGQCFVSFAFVVVGEPLEVRGSLEMARDDVIHLDRSVCFHHLLQAESLDAQLVNHEAGSDLDVAYRRIK